MLSLNIILLYLCDLLDRFLYYMVRSKRMGTMSVLLITVSQHPVE